MFLLPWSRPERPTVRGRVRLSLHSLDDRAAPSSLTTTADPLTLTPATTADASLITTTVPGVSPADGPAEGDPRTPANLAPMIVDLSVQRLDSGLYRISGRVLDENPGGLVVNLGGIPSVQGLSVITNADGTFTIDVPLKTDGSDAGWVTAITRDASGLVSNLASCWVDPK